SPQFPLRSRSPPCPARFAQLMRYSAAADPPRFAKVGLSSLNSPYFHVPSGAPVYVRALAPVPTVNVPPVTVTVLVIGTQDGSPSVAGSVYVSQSMILRSPVEVV